jgi:hypothetical protein
VSKLIRVKYKGTCVACGEPIQVGASVNWERGEGCWHIGCDPEIKPEPDGFPLGVVAGQARELEKWESSQRRRDEQEYQKGVAEGNRYIAEKKVYGEALADRFAFEDEFNRYWKNGEDD